MSPKTYRKKPIEIKAWKVDDINRAAVADGWAGMPQEIIDDHDHRADDSPNKGGWIFDCLEDGVGPRRGIYVPTLEGSLFAAPGDWIIQGIAGEFYPCKPDIFAATYEAVESAGEVSQ